MLHSFSSASSLYNISAKTHPNFLQNLAFESFFDKYFIAISHFPNIFEQRHLFDDKHGRIWPLDLSE